MAVCVSADGYHDVGTQQLGYGTPCTYTGDALKAGADGPGPAVPASPHAAWPLMSPSTGEALPVPYWQDASEQSEYCTGAPLEWPGSGAGNWPPLPGPNGGGEWRAASGRGPSSAGRPKRRFCTSYPDVGMCRRGTSCAFAHAREEISASLLDIDEENQEPSALTDGFFMYKYKTRWCPVGVQHEWHTCVYAHNYQDARRPISIGYGARLCPYWSKKDTGAGYSQRCPLGLRCPYSHGAKEQLYHPHYFKTVVCRDLRGKACPRQRLCAFFHSRAERRASPPDDVDYSQPLRNEALPSDWIAEFLAPPFLPESSRGACLNEDCGTTKVDSSGPSGGNAVVPYGPGPHMAQPAAQFGPQMPCVFLLPMGAMVPQAMGMQPTAAVGATSELGSTPGLQPPNGMQSLPPNWVFVPMENGGNQMS